MRNFKLTTLALAAACAFASCEINYDIGSDLTPESQEMSTGNISFGRGDGLVSSVSAITSRHYRSSRINVAQQHVGHMGVHDLNGLGRRSSGFFSQYTPMIYVEDENGFGTNAMLDSVLFYPSISEYAGDTTAIVKYEVYNIIGDDFVLNSADSVFTLDEITAELASSDVLGDMVFSFEYPDQSNGIYTTSLYVRMDITDAGRALMKRLMLQDEDDDFDYTIYSYEEYYDDEDADYYDYSEFVDNFKGLYIKPVSYRNSTVGATYSMDLTTAGWGFYGRSVSDEDYTLVADTVGMTYIFMDEYSVEAGGVNANVSDRDYLSTLSIKIDDEVAGDPTTKICVEGNSGVLNELTFEKHIFETLYEAVLADEGDFTNLFINNAKLSLYLEGVNDYDSYVLDNFTSINELSNIPTRLGLYTYVSNFYDDDGYMELTLIPEYDYYTEASEGTVSEIDGTFNRNKGCYVLNIPLQLEGMWSEYRDLRIAGELDDITQEEWDELTWNKIYLAPLVDELFTTKSVELQGPSDEAAPLKLDITYTLLRE